MSVIRAFVFLFNFIPGAEEEEEKRNIPQNSFFLMPYHHMSTKTKIHRHKSTQEGFCFCVKRSAPLRSCVRQA